MLPGSSDWIEERKKETDRSSSHSLSVYTINISRLHLLSIHSASTHSSQKNPQTRTFRRRNISPPFRVIVGSHCCRSKEKTSSTIHSITTSRIRQELHHSRIGSRITSLKNYIKDYITQEFIKDYITHGSFSGNRLKGCLSSSSSVFCPVLSYSKNSTLRNGRHSSKKWV